MILLQRRSGLFDLSAIQQSNPERYPFLLQSSASGGEAANARYDILFAFPGQRLRLDSEGCLEGQHAGEQHDFLAALDNWWRQESAYHESEDTALPFQGGWFLYLGYELAGQIETRLRLPQAAAGQPVAEAVRIPAAIINDRLKNETLLFTEAGDAKLMDTLLADLDRVSTEGIGSSADGSEGITMRADPESRYLQHTQRVKRYIYEGDVFQVNLSRKWQAKTTPELDAAVIYQRLCQ